MAKNASMFDAFKSASSVPSEPNGHFMRMLSASEETEEEMEGEKPKTWASERFRRYAHDGGSTFRAGDVFGDG